MSDKREERGLPPICLLEPLSTTNAARLGRVFIAKSPINNLPSRRLKKCHLGVQNIKILQKNLYMSFFFSNFAVFINLRRKWANTDHELQTNYWKKV